MPTTAMPWRPSKRLSGRLTWTLWWGCLPTLVLAVVLQHLTVVDPVGIGLLPLPAGIAFLWLTLAYLWADRPPRRRVLGLTVVAVLLTAIATGLAIGTPPVTAARTSAATALQAVATLALYRWRTGDANIVPHRPVDVGNLLLASLLGALVVIPTFPAPHYGPTSPVVEHLAWLVLSGGGLFIAGSCVLLLTSRGPRSEAVPTRLLDVYVQLLVAAIILALVFTTTGYPLTWLVMLSAIWAGMTMGPWTAAAYALTGALASAVAQAVPATHGEMPSVDLQHVLLFDTLLITFVFVVLQLSLLRDQREHLAGEVAQRRHEAVQQAGLFGTVFESIAEAIVLIDRDGAVRMHNNAAVRLLGRERLRTEPGTWLQHLPEEPAFTYPFHRDDGEDGVRMLAVQLGDVGSTTVGSRVAIARDVTSEQRRIEELTSFAAVAAHDLKGPLAAVQGWLEVAEDTMGSDPGTASRALERGRDATDRMAREIEDWLTYNVAREGVVTMEQVALQPLVEDVVLSHPEADIVVDTPDAVRADPTLLRHLMVNLIANAVKYTPVHDKPVVSVRSQPEPDAGWVRIYVVDAGIGIPEGEETSIFEPFHRGSTVTAYDGSGLGLALCRRIVLRHGGTITAERNQGPGSTFVLTLPGG